MLLLFLHFARKLLAQKNKHSNNVAKMIQVRQTNPSDKTVEESVCRGDMYLDSFEALQVSLGFEG